MELPTIETYGDYASSNYGAHALRVTVGPLTVWYSYKTTVAFQVGYGALIVRRNEWGPTTGKHLNAIDGGDKKSRFSGADFQEAWNVTVEPLLTVHA